MRLLFIGDIIGSPGRKKITTFLDKIIEKENIHFTIAQGENIAGGIGITEDTANELLEAGVDCITCGNHVWKHKTVYNYLDKEKHILRPANYPEEIPGKGFCIYEKNSVKIGVINLEGRAFMQAKENPFRKGRYIAEHMQNETRNIFVDFHAEATSEKRALGLYLAECVTGFIGTHTHVQTADEQLIDNKTAYITDVGMVGALSSVIGVNKEEVIDHYLLSIPQKFRVAKHDIVANSVIIDFDENNGQARSIVRFNF
jgi:metallophosphoesterase (TIGR00282 family)